MTQLRDQLQAAYEERGYDVSDVTDNRGLVRVVLAEEAGADDVRSIVTDVVGQDSIRGLNVTTESVDGHDGVSTVVSFRDRS